MYLEQVNDPRDLKKLTVPQLDELAAEIRQFLIEKLAVTGGHLAPNLGIVELTLALHKLYDSPRDKFLFDVGHQAYVHKILTGRREKFDTLRKYQGLCGFVKRSESEHDVWEAGHSSTSLSGAMGFAVARDLKGDDNHVVAIIGDGSLTGGMALEALNHIGHEKKNLLVVLNDNEMSIAPNVGALHHYLAKIRGGRLYHKVKDEVEQLLHKIPAIGDKLADVAERVKDAAKYALVGGILFEQLGYTYFGPVDGHDLPQLLETLDQAKHTPGPVLVHVITTKGKGYTPAESDSHKWHGISPYKVEDGAVIKSDGPPMYTEVFGDTLIELAQQDERIVAVTPAMPGGSGLMKYWGKFPNRMFDVGIAEQHAATMCAAMALDGLKPVYAVYSTFLQRAYDQVVHDICRHNANVVFAIDRAGFVGPDGETHQGVYDIAYLRHIPNIVLMMPKDENELRHMMKTAIDYNNGPIAVRYPRIAGVGVPMDSELKAIPIGKWEKLRLGSAAAILAIGPMVEIARQASAVLAEQHIEVTVINARFMKPLDADMLRELKASGMPLIVLEEGCEAGGLGSAVLEFYSKEQGASPSVTMMAIPDIFVEHGTVAEQRRDTGLTVEHVVANVNKVRENVRIG